MGEDLMLKCLIAFILGWLVSRMMGNGFSVSGGSGLFGLPSWVDVYDYGKRKLEKHQSCKKRAGKPDRYEPHLLVDCKDIFMGPQYVCENLLKKKPEECALTNYGQSCDDFYQIDELNVPINSMLLPEGNICKRGTKIITKEQLMDMLPDNLHNNKEFTDMCNDGNCTYCTAEPDEETVCDRKVIDAATMSG